MFLSALWPTRTYVFLIYSSERAHRSRQYDRGTSAERRYKRSHRRSPTSKKRHRHRHDRSVSRRKHSRRSYSTDQVSLFATESFLSFTDALVVRRLLIKKNQKQYKYFIQFIYLTDIPTVSVPAADLIFCDFICMVVWQSRF